MAVTAVIKYANKKYYLNITSNQCLRKKEITKNIIMKVLE